MVQVLLFTTASWRVYRGLMIDSVHRRFLSSAQKVPSFFFVFVRRVHCSTEGLYKMMATPVPVIQSVSTVKT